LSNGGGKIDVLQSHSGHPEGDLNFGLGAGVRWALLKGPSDRKRPLFVALTAQTGSKPSIVFSDLAKDRLRILSEAASIDLQESHEDRLVEIHEAFEHVFTEFLVVPDLDRDGVEDLAVAATGGGLMALSSSSGKILWRARGIDAEITRLALCPADDALNRPAKIAVIRAGGRIEAVCPFSGLMLRAIETTLSPSACIPVRIRGTVGILLGDVSGVWIAHEFPVGALRQITFEAPASIATGNLIPDDMTDEIVVAVDGRIKVFDPWGGPPLLDWPAETEFGKLTCGNLDQQAGDEIVLAESNGFVVAYAGNSGRELWRFEARGAFGHDPQIEDLDGDGFGEVVVQAGDERLRVLAGSPKRRHWVHETPWPIGTRPVSWVSEKNERIIITGTAGKTTTFPYDGAMWGPTIHGIDAKTGRAAWPPSRAKRAYMWCPDVADCDGDGEVDTVAMDRAGRLVVIRARDGKTTEHPFDAGAVTAIRPRLSDLDRNGASEIVHVTSEGGHHVVRAFSASTKTDLWARGFQLDSNATRILTGDLGTDGHNDVVCGLENGTIAVIDGHSGKLVRVIERGGSEKASMTIADVTGDGRADLVAGIHDYGPEEIPKHLLVAYDGTDLREMWRFPNPDLNSGVEADPCVADLDGDGAPDIAFADWKGFLHACRGDTGEDLWGKPVRVGRSGFFSSPAVGDVYGDGDVEIVIGGKDRLVYVVDGRTGTIVRSYGVGAEVFGSPLLTNLDEDDTLDIVIGADDGKLHAILGSTTSPR
jgi:outer membrane protein assembly factor BamB